MKHPGQAGRRCEGHAEIVRVVNKKHFRDKANRPYIIYLLVGIASDRQSWILIKKD